MSWLTLYAVIGICVATFGVVISDRNGSPELRVSLLAGFVWPLILVAMLQLSLWMAAMRTTRMHSSLSG